MGKKDKKPKDDVKDKLKELESRLTESEGRCAEYLELAQRVQADFENYKKRAGREREDQRKFANQQIVEEFLEVKDNLERALENQADTKSLTEGITLTLKQLDTLLKRHGVEEINPQGQAFNPNYHEALMYEEGDVAEETVAEVLQKGYALHERVVRPAKVRITKPKQEE